MLPIHHEVKYGKAHIPVIFYQKNMAEFVEMIFFGAGSCHFEVTGHAPA